MPTYNGPAVSDAVIGFRKPITLQQGRALRDNPLAIAEGSNGAFYNQSAWHPYNGLTVGDGNTGQIWSLASDGLVTAIETPDFVDGYEYAVRAWDVSHNQGSDQSLVVRARRQSDGTLASPTFAISGETPGNVPVSASVELIQPRRSVRIHQSGLGLLSVDIGIVDKIKNLRFTWSPAASASFDAGAVFLYRRRVYA